ncbi:MAG: septum site-determining protein MinC [Eubacteriales bacterium]
MKNIVSFKGISSGCLEILCDEVKSYNAIKEALVKRIEQNDNFFRGATSKVLIAGRNFEETEMHEIKEIFLRRFGLLNVVFKGPSSKTAPKHTEKKIKDIKTENDKRDSAEKSSKSGIELVSNDYFDARSIIISHTLRNGQRVECEGDVVVLGDVNNGAEIVAGGSIIVIGALRGLAHAGATGRAGVVIAANKLCPKQLRINAKIAIFPEGASSLVPEIAKIEDGNITITDVNQKHFPMKQQH